MGSPRRTDSPGEDAETTARPPVGVPIHERLLTDAFLDRSVSLVRPGPGRSVFVIEEPELGSGRPDLVFLTIPVGALDKFRRSGLRLVSPSVARVLAPGADDAPAGVSKSYAAAVRRGLMEQGWGDVDVQRLADLVTDTFAVEAKVKDWRRAIQQVSRFRRHFHRSAILMPSRQLPDESLRSLDFYGCGLLFQEGQSVSWIRQPRTLNPSISSRLWVLELLVRGLDSGTAYRLSDARNRVTASR